MSVDSQTAVRNGYRAIGLGVGDAMLRLFGQGTAAGDESGRPRWQVIDLSSGRRGRTREIVAEDLFGSIPAHWQVTQVQPQSFRPEEGALVVTGHIVCRPSGHNGVWDTVRVPFAHVWFMHDGQAVRVRSYLDGIELVRA